MIGDLARRHRSAHKEAMIGEHFIQREPQGCDRGIIVRANALIQPGRACESQAIDPRHVAPSLKA
jgi:hypothetical protein